MSSSRRRSSRSIRKYLDDSDEEAVVEEQAEEKEVEPVRTPQDRYVPGIGRRKVVYNTAGKALRLHTDTREAWSAADAGQDVQLGQEESVSGTGLSSLRAEHGPPLTEAESSWLVIYDPPLQPAPPAQAAKLPVTRVRSAFRRRLKGATS